MWGGSPLSLALLPHCQSGPIGTQYNISLSGHDFGKLNFVCCLPSPGTSVHQGAEVYPTGTDGDPGNGDGKIPYKGERLYKYEVSV